MDEGLVIRESTGQTRRFALQSDRDSRMIVVAMEALAFWHEQERCSCVSS